MAWCNPATLGEPKTTCESKYFKMLEEQYDETEFSNNFMQ